MPLHVVPPPCNPPSLLHRSRGDGGSARQPRRTAMPLRRAIAYSRRGRPGRAGLLCEPITVRSVARAGGNTVHRLVSRAASCRRSSRPEWHLAGVRDRELSISRITRRSRVRIPSCMGAYGAGPAGQSIVEGGEIPYQPEALAKKKQNFENRHEGRRQQRQDVARARRSGDEVLHAGRAARDLHAVSVSDRAGHRARTS